VRGASRTLAKSDPSGQKSHELIPWDHGPNARPHCFGDVPELRITERGLYTIVDTQNPQYAPYIGCRVSIGDRNTSRILREMMRFIDKLFTSHGVAYCVYSGALLGCMRHSDIIPWDNDLDLIIPISDAEKVASLENEINGSGYIYAEHKKHGYAYKIYVKSPENPDIMAEIASIFPYSVDHPDYGPFLIWKTHPIMQANIFDRIMAMTNRNTALALPTRALLGTDNIQNIKQQIEVGDIAISYQYFDHEIYPLRRKRFANFSVNVPNRAKTVLIRDYGQHSLLYGTVGCGCQWIEGKYLFRVKIDSVG
jgi:LicD family